MGIISWIIMGLIAGAVAKWLMPGKDPGGFFVTMFLGIAGGVLGGYIGTMLGLGKVDGFDLRSFGLAVAGAFVILYLYRVIKARK